MKVQSVSLSFGTKHNNSKTKEPSILGSTIVGAGIGAAGGAIAREKAPVQDDFFVKTASKPNSKKEVKNAIIEFIDNYGKQEIEEIRALKTAIQETGLNDVLSKENISIKNDLNNNGLQELLEDPSIKVIGDKDSDELKNAVKVLKQDILNDFNFTEDTRVEKKVEVAEVFSKNAGEKALEAKNLISSKKALTEYSEALAGLGKKGSSSIKAIKEIIQAKPLMEQVSKGFDTMVKHAAKSQRKKAVWVAIPSGLLAIGNGTKAGKKKAALNN